MLQSFFTHLTMLGLRLDSYMLADPPQPTFPFSIPGVSSRHDQSQRE